MKTLTAHDYLELAHRYRWWLILPIVLGLAVATALAFVLPKSYLSSTLIFVDPQKVPEEYVKTTVTGSIEDRLSTIRQQLLSRTLLQRTIDEFHLYQEKTGKATAEEIIDYMRNQITIETVRGRNVDAFTISFVGNDPTTTMNVTNRLASLFIEENLKIREQLVEGTTDFLNVELKQLKQKLETQEQTIINYKQKYMGSLPSQLDANLRTLDRLQSKLQALNASILEVEQRTAVVIGPVTGVVSESSLSRSEQLRVLQRRLGELQAEYTDSYPDIALVKGKIAQLQAEIQADNAAKDAAAGDHPDAQKPANKPAKPSVNPELAQLQTEKQSVLNDIAEYEQRVEATPKREQELASLLRDYENTKNSYDALASKTDNATISENLEKRQKGEQFRILDPANLPEKPFRPNLLILLAMGMLIGAGLGVGLVFVREGLDTSIKKANELEEEFGLPVLAVIPKTDALKKIAPLNGNGAAAHARQPIPKGERS